MSTFVQICYYDILVAYRQHISNHSHIYVYIANHGVYVFVMTRDLLSEFVCRLGDRRFVAGFDWNDSCDEVRLARF